MLNALEGTEQFCSLGLSSVIVSLIFFQDLWTLRKGVTDLLSTSSDTFIIFDVF
jgi:hypothetical protein